jgi:signal transduction histidine kinase
MTNTALHQHEHAESETLRVNSAQEWLTLEKRQIVNVLIRWGRGFLLAGIIMTIVVGLFYAEVIQVWLILLGQLASLGVNYYADYLLKHDRLGLSAGLLIGLQVGLSIMAALMFNNMVFDYAILVLLHIYLTTLMVSPRAGITVGIGLGIIGIALGAIMLSELYIPPITPPAAIELMLHVFIFLIAITMGTFLIQKNTRNTQHTVALLLEQSIALRQTNKKLAHEIDARQQAEQERMRLVLENARITAISNFIRDASHEFRNPLAIIKTSLYMLQRTAGSPVTAPHLGQIETQIDHINELLESMMEMTRLDSGIKLVFHPYDVNRILRNINTRFGPDMLEKDAITVLQLDDTMPEIECDSQRLHLALTNIFQNAVEHIPSGGTITVQTTCTARQITIAISDNGPGIPPETLPHIFERFYRGDKARTTRGVGLGLPIAQKIVELHHGTITAHSPTDKGSTFIIQLPVEHRTAE